MNSPNSCPGDNQGKIRVSLRFYEELNDFLPEENRKTEFFKTIFSFQTLKDVMFSFGIPENAVDLILANGRSVPFSYAPEEGDRISIFPVFESFDISSVTKLRSTPLRRLDFVLDVHLGKLAKYLRMLGFDTLYRNDYTDHEIILISQKTGRVILTRDRALLKKNRMDRGYLVESTEIRRQVEEVIDRFQLLTRINPLILCLSCNSPVRMVEKSSVKGRIDPYIYGRFDEFSHCTGCRRIFWKGSHYLSMIQFIHGLGNLADGKDA